MLATVAGAFGSKAMTMSPQLVVSVIPAALTSGLDMVQEVASVGVADGSGDGTPRQPVFIESATVQPNE